MALVLGIFLLCWEKTKLSGLNSELQADMMGSTDRNWNESVLLVDKDSSKTQLIRKFYFIEMWLRGNFQILPTRIDYIFSSLEADYFHGQKMKCHCHVHATCYLYITIISQVEKTAQYPYSRSNVHVGRLRTSQSMPYANVQSQCVQHEIVCPMCTEAECKGVVDIVRSEFDVQETRVRVTSLQGLWWTFIFSLIVTTISFESLTLTISYLPCADIVESNNFTAVGSGCKKLNIIHGSAE